MWANSAARRADSFGLAPEIPGLILEEAIYGVLESTDDKVSDEVDVRWLDVTGKLFQAHLRIVLWLTDRSPSTAA